MRTRTLLVLTMSALLAAAVMGWYLVVRGKGDMHVAMPHFASASQPVAEVAARAKAGEPDAQYQLGVIYRDGLDGPPRPRQALEWFDRAARQRHVRAMVALGGLLEQGGAVKADPYKAADWYRVAAQLGDDPEAEFRLGEMHFSGRGVVQSYGEAIDWYRRAAERGHPAAQFLIGAMYEHGWGVDRDPLQAYMWYTLVLPRAAEAMAVRRTFNPAKARERLAQGMSQFQIREARREAAAWKPSR